MKISSASHAHYRRSIGLHNNHVQQNAPKRKERSLPQHIANQEPLLPQARLSVATLMTVISSTTAQAHSNNLKDTAINYPVIVKPDYALSCKQSSLSTQGLQSVNRSLDWSPEEHTGYGANIAVAGMSSLTASYMYILVAAFLNMQRERRRENRIASFVHFMQFLDVVDHLKNNVFQQQPLPLPQEMDLQNLQMDFQELPLPLQWRAILREIFNEEIAHDEYLVPAEIRQAQQAVAEVERLLVEQLLILPGG